MLLDQQMPMERAFLGPAKLAERLGQHPLDPRAIATWDPDDFLAICATPPAVHRYPRSMAARIQALAAAIVERYDGDTASLWRSADSGEEVRARLAALPGFGAAKAAIFTALLGKQLGVRPPGWSRPARRTANRGRSGPSPTSSTATPWPGSARPRRRPRRPPGRGADMGDSGPTNRPTWQYRGASMTPDVLQWSSTRPGSLRHLVDEIAPSPRDRVIGTPRR